MTRKVMVVDDDLPTLEVMKLLLRQIGWDAVIMDNPVEALSFIRKEEPEIILLDIMMRPMNGWEFLDQLRGTEHGGHIPVVLFTAKEIWPEEFSRYRDHIAGVLKKPVLPIDLKQALEQYV